MHTYDMRTIFLRDKEGYFLNAQDDVLVIAGRLKKDVVLHPNRPSQGRTNRVPKFARYSSNRLRTSRPFSKHLQSNEGSNLSNLLQENAGRRRPRAQRLVKSFFRPRLGGFYGDSKGFYKAAQIAFRTLAPFAYPIA